MTFRNYRLPLSRHGIIVMNPLHDQWNSPVNIILIMAIIYWYHQSESSISVWVITLACVALSLRILELPIYQLEALQKNAGVTLYRFICFLVFSLFRVIILYYFNDEVLLTYLLITLVLENIISFIVPFIVFTRLNYRLILNFGSLCDDRTLKSCKESMYLFFSSVSVILYMKVDIIILDMFVSKDSIGQYIAMTKLAELSYFPITIFIMTISPILVFYIKNSDLKRANDTMRLMFIIVYLYCCLLIISTVFFSDWISASLLGYEFQEVGGLWKIYAFCSFAVAVGLISSRAIVSYDLSHYLLRRSCFGLVANVLLNLLLIPKFGTEGAAIGTLCSFSLAIFGSVIISKKLYNLYGFNLIKVKTNQSFFKIITDWRIGI